MTTLTARYTRVYVTCIMGLLNLKRHRSCTARSTFFFAERVSNASNSLSCDVNDFSTLAAFKHTIGLESFHSINVVYLGVVQA